MKSLVMRGKRALRPLFLFWAVCLCANAVTPPEWAKPFLDGEAVKWREHAPFVVVLTSIDSIFTEDRQIIMHVQCVLRANSDEGISKLIAPCPYVAGSTQVTALQAWVVDPRGKTQVIPRGKFTDVANSGDPLYWNNSRAYVYRAENAEPGTTLIFEFTLHMPAESSTTRWAVPPQFPLYHGSFHVTPRSGCRLTSFSVNPLVAPPGEAAADGSLRWSIDRIAPTGAGAPVGFHALPLRIDAFCVPKNPADDYREKTWESFGAWFTTFFDAKTTSSPEIDAAVQNLTQAAKTRWEKIRILSEYVQKRIKYLAVTEDSDTFAGCRPHPASEIFSQGLGDCKDKVTLLMTMLHSLGEAPRPILAFAGNPLEVDASRPNNSFNHAIIGIPIDADTPKGWPVVETEHGDKLVLFDPTNPFIPLGLLPDGDLGGHILVLHGNRSAIVQVPGNAYTAPILVSDLSLKIEGTNEVAATDNADLGGLAAVAAYHSFSTQSSEEIRRHWENQLRDRKLIPQKIAWTVAGNDKPDRCDVHLTFLAEGCLSRAGNQMLFTPPFNSQAIELRPWSTKFPGGSWLYRYACDDRIRLALPPGTTAVELPPHFRMETRDGAFADIDYSRAGDEIVCRYQFERPAGLYEKNQYDELRAMGEKLLKARRLPVVLTFSPEPAALAPGGPPAAGAKI